MATLYSTNGAVVEVHPHHDKAFTLAEAHALVGGYIEVAPQPKWATNLNFWSSHVVLVDEDGRLRPAAQENSAASRLCEQRLFGAVLVLTQPEWEAAMAAPDVDDRDAQGAGDGAGDGAGGEDDGNTGDGSEPQC